MIQIKIFGKLTELFGTDTYSTSFDKKTVSFPVEKVGMTFRPYLPLLQ